MSTPPSFVSFYVVNNTGRTMPTLWANHNTSDTPIQPYMLTNVASSPTPQFLGQLEIVSRTDDYFTVMWTDPSNNVYGTPYQYSAETDIDGGNVTIQILSSTFQFFQQNESPLNDPTAIIEYVVA